MSYRKRFFRFRYIKCVFAMPEALQQQTAKLLAHSNYYIPHDISKPALFGTALTCIFIYSPPMWTGVCRTGSIVHLTPHSTLSCCSMPRASARLPYSFTAQGIIIIRLLMHRPLMLFLLLLRFLVSTADFPFFLFYITGKHFIAKPNTIIL